jgi:signal transduction histidine kinase
MILKKRQLHLYLVLFLVLLVPMLFYYPALVSDWESNSDIHALMEFAAALVALTAALLVINNFVSYRKTGFLIISLGLILQGTNDLVHAFLSFNRLWGSNAENLHQFIPGTYSTGRILLVLSFFVAFHFLLQDKKASRPVRMAVLSTIIGLVTAIVLNYIAYYSRLPRLIFQDQVISRPLDFFTLFLYIFCTGTYLWYFIRNKSLGKPFNFCLVASLILGSVTQVYMVHSQKLYDAQFDVSHAVKVFSYLFIIFGFGYGLIFIMKENYENLLIKNKNIIIEEINNLFKLTMSGKSEYEIAEECLAIGERISRSRFGYLGLINPETGLFDTLALSNPGWDSCSMSQDEARKSIINMPIEGLDRGTMLDGKPRIVNDLKSHPDHREPPKGHPRITCFLGVPIMEGDKPVGMIGLGNKPGGYDEADCEAVTDLVSAFWISLKTIQSETKLKQLNSDQEEIISSKTRELIMKNMDLEQIVYVTSHDLRSPLVNVKGFSKELAVSISEMTDVLNTIDISEDARQKIERITNEDIPESIRFINHSVEKMDSLLKALLKLSRLGREEFTMTDLDVNDIVRKVQNAFEYQLREYGINFVRNYLPGCYGDEDHVNQLFSNLVNNAIKYRNPDVEPTILIRGEEKEGRSIFYVEDNGIGISEDHQHNIFRIFHRLEPDKTEGDGLGLTIVKRIVEKHRGSISVRSEPGKGSVFIVELPATSSSAVDQG